MQKFSPVAYDCVFPITAIGCSAHYCSKHGLDFLFALIAPIIYLPSMLIYNGGFSSSTLSTNLILLVVYLVAEFSDFSSATLLSVTSAVRKKRQNRKKQRKCFLRQSAVKRKSLRT